jgi:nitroreductase
MELSKALYGRRATREYTPEPVERAQLDALIDAAIQAPSAMNLQPWGFCILRNTAMMDRISREANALMLKSPLPTSPHHHLADMLGNPEFHIFYHAPVLILICAIGGGPWPPIDCTLAAQNLMLAAHGAGLGSCWIGLAQGWLETDAGRAALDLPENWQPVAPIIIGHPRGITPAPPRNKPELRWRD